MKLLHMVLFSQILLNILKINSNSLRSLPHRLHVHVTRLIKASVKKKKRKENTKIATVTNFMLVPAATLMAEEAKTYIV